MKAYFQRFAFYAVFCVLLTGIMLFVAELAIPSIAKVLASVEPVTISPWVKLVLIMAVVCALISIREP